MSINFSDILSMGAQALPLLGMDGKSSNMMSKAAEIWAEFKKYPQTPEGLRQALGKYSNVNEAQVAGAMTVLDKNPKLKALVESKLPGSMDAVLAAIKDKGALPTPPSMPEPTGAAMGASVGGHSDRVKQLLAAAARK